MANLLISKINDIQVFQVGSSRLSLENKREDGSIFGGGDNSDGQTKTIDLGKGKKQHSFQVFAFDRQENDALFKVLYEERFCKIVDKFLGTLNVYVDRVDTTNSDKHLDRTIYDISCTVQDAEFLATPNFAAQLTNETKQIEVEISEEVQNLAEQTETFAEEKLGTPSVLEKAAGAMKFVDEALDMVRTGINAVLEVQSAALGAYNAVKSRIDQAKRLVNTIKNLADFPSQLADLLKEITNDSLTDIGTNSVTGKSKKLAVKQKSEITPIVEPVISGVPASEINTDDLSQFKLEDLAKQETAARLVNKVKILRDIKSLLAGGFTSQDDFELTVNAIVERLDYAGYTEDEKSAKVYTVKSYANQQEYAQTQTIEIPTGRPLAAIVYELYGDLNRLDEIAVLNNLGDADDVRGEIKIYA